MPAGPWSSHRRISSSPKRRSPSSQSRRPCAARAHGRGSLFPVRRRQSPGPSRRSRHTADRSWEPAPGIREDGKALPPTSGMAAREAQGASLARSLAGQRLRGPPAARSPRPPRQARRARAAPLPACEAVTMGAARAAPGGS